MLLRAFIFLKEDKNHGINPTKTAESRYPVPRTDRIPYFEIERMGGTILWKLLALNR